MSEFPDLLSNNNMDPKSCQFFTRAQLECGAYVQLAQREIGSPWELIITPKENRKIEDFARIHENQVRINMHQNSALGFYQLLEMMIHPRVKVNRVSVRAGVAEIFGAITAVGAIAYGHTTNNLVYIGLGIMIMLAVILNPRKKVI